MVSPAERVRIYYLGSEDATCSEAFRYFPGASIQRVSEDVSLNSQIGRPEDLESPRCLVWAVPLSLGLTARRQLRQDGIAIPSVAIIDAEEASRSMPLHACDAAFVVRPASVPAIVEQVRHALRIDMALIPERRQRAHVQGQLSRLSDREAEVLELIIAGRSTKEIGSKLYIGTQTVLKHRANILKKLGTRNDVELTLKVWQYRSAPACHNCCEPRPRELPVSIALPSIN